MTDERLVQSADEPPSLGHATGASIGQALADALPGRVSRATSTGLRGRSTPVTRNRLLSGRYTHPRNAEPGRLRGYR
jgi:hypothetical protein